MAEKEGEGGIAQGSTERLLRKKSDGGEEVRMNMDEHGGEREGRLENERRWK